MPVPQEANGILFSSVARQRFRLVFFTEQKTAAKKMNDAWGEALHSGVPVFLVQTPKIANLPALLADLFASLY